MESIDDLVIAKIDATANDLEGIEILSFPTLKFFPKKNKSGIDYREDRKLEDFQKWLSENS